MKLDLSVGGPLTNQQTLPQSEALAAAGTRQVTGRSGASLPPRPLTASRLARNWAVLSAGLSAFLPSGLQPFVAVSTVQGNENFVSYVGGAGLRAVF